MSMLRDCGLKLLVVALSISICSCSSESVLNSQEDTTQSQSSPTEPPKEPRVRPSHQQPPTDNVAEHEGGRREDGDSSKREKLVVAYIPDYPSKYVQQTHTNAYTHSLMCWLYFPYPQNHSSRDAGQYKSFDYGNVLHSKNIF